MYMDKCEGLVLTAQRGIIPQTTVKFEKRDVWIGAYWNFSKSVESRYRRLIIYVCIIPMLPLRLEWAWGFRQS